MRGPDLAAALTRLGLRHTLAAAFVRLVLAIAAALVLVPLLFMATASLMPASDILASPFRWIPSGLRWENYRKALAGNDESWLYARNVLNSLIVSGSVAALTVSLSACVGYGFAKFRFKGREIAFMAIMATMMIPFETVMVPLYMVVLRLGLQDSYAGLILPFMMSAFGVFLMRQYLLGFPDDILDAARIDGCSEWRIFWSVIRPSIGPAAATLAVLAFRQQWDNLLWPLLVVQSEEMKTIPAYIVKFAAEKHADEGAMMAVAVIASLPVFALFLTLSKFFLGGSAVFAAAKE